MDVSRTAPYINSTRQAMGPSVVVIALLIVLAPQAVALRLDHSANSPAVMLSLPSSLAEEWAADEPALSEWRPHFTGASAEARQTYAGPLGRVAVHVAYYRNQDETRKLVTSGNVLVHSDDRQWNPIRQGAEVVAVPGGELRLRTAELLGASSTGAVERTHLRVWQFYWIGGRMTSSALEAKLQGAWQRLSGQGDESAAIVVYALDDPRSTAERRLSAFMRANLGVLDQRLQAARRDR